MRNNIIFCCLLLLLTSCHSQENENNSIGIIGGADGPTAIFVTGSNKTCTRCIKEGLETLNEIKSLAKDSNYVHFCCLSTKVIEEIKTVNELKEFIPSQIFIISNLNSSIKEKNKVLESSKDIYIDRCLKYIPMKINSLEGSSWLAAANILAIDKVFLEKGMKDTKLLIYQLNNDLTGMVLLQPNEEHIVREFACLVKNKLLADIQSKEELIQFFDEYLDLQDVQVNEL